MVDDVAAKNKRARGEEKRLTVVLSDYDHRRLKYISDKLGESAGAFARNILVAALDDAEKLLKLEEHDPEPRGTDVHGDDFYRLSDYGHYINNAADDLEDDLLKDLEVPVPELNWSIDE